MTHVIKTFEKITQRPEKITHMLLKLVKQNQLLTLATLVGIRGLRLSRFEIVRFWFCFMNFQKICVIFQAAVLLFFKDFYEICVPEKGANVPYVTGLLRNT